MEKVYLAFQKAWNNKNSSFLSRIIAYWTMGPYSHVEIVFKDEEECGGWVMCSSLGTEGGVRCKPHIIDTNLYDYKELKVISSAYIKKFFKQLIKNRTSYDFLAIVLSQLIKLGIDKNNKWFCSEAVARALQISCSDIEDLWYVKTEQLSPNDLARIVGLIEYKNKPTRPSFICLLKNNMEDIYKPFGITKINKW